MPDRDPYDPPLPREPRALERDDAPVSPAVSAHIEQARREREERARPLPLLDGLERQDDRTTSMRRTVP